MTEDKVLTCPECGSTEVTVDQWINEMAHAFGFEHWIQAYHELDA